MEKVIGSDDIHILMVCDVNLQNNTIVYLVCSLRHDIVQLAHYG